MGVPQNGMFVVDDRIKMDDAGVSSIPDEDVSREVCSPTKGPPLQFRTFLLPSIHGRMII